MTDLKPLLEKARAADIGLVGMKAARFLSSSLLARELRLAAVTAARTSAEGVLPSRIWASITAIAAIRTIFWDPLFGEFASYSRPLFGNRIRWKALLNVRNAIGSDKLLPVTIQPWGEVARVREHYTVRTTCLA